MKLHEPRARPADVRARGVGARVPGVVDELYETDDRRMDVGEGVSPWNSSSALGRPPTLIDPTPRLELLLAL